MNEQEAIELIENTPLFRSEADKTIHSDLFNALAMGVKALEEIQQYRELGTVKELREAEYKGGWIPCSERLPEDNDMRFYMCVQENHEEDVPAHFQYEEEYGFGYWRDYYDAHSLGFLDSEFITIEEEGLEKVIAWQQLPEPYNSESNK